MTILFEKSSPLVRAVNAKTPTWFWDGSSSLTVDSKLICALESYSDSMSTNCRICLHSSTESPCHTMLIVERKGMNIPPHYHANKSDFVFVIRGTLICFEFDIDGQIISHVILKEGQGHKSGLNVIHAIGINSTSCTYFETSDGPFLKVDDSVFPSWAAAWHRQYLDVAHNF